MSKYKIEGGIDFFSELYKSLDALDIEETDNMCLISNEPLTDKYITMGCGHMFNYIPLYMDIKNHKQKFNSMEGTATCLYHDEIRCPYCRKKQKGLLPYYEELGLAKIRGVNYIDHSSSSQHYKKCEFLTPNLHFDPSGMNIVETTDSNSGNCKFLKCFHLGTQIHYYSTGPTLNYGDDKYYCGFHKKQVVKKYKKDILDKSKEEAKQAKLKEKEEAKQAKLKEKEETKQAKTSFH